MITMKIKQWIAMDLSDKENEVCLIDEVGKKISSHKIDNRPDMIDQFFSEFDKNIDTTLIIEAGTCSGWICEIAESHGITVIVANPRKLRAIWDTVNKSDERDAELLARLGRVDPLLLAPIKHRSMEAQAHLSVIRLRETAVKMRGIASNSIRGTLKTLGIFLEDVKSPEQMPKKAPQQLPTNLLKLVEPLLIAMSTLNQQINDYDKKIEKLCKTIPTCQQFMQINGVGPITALTFYLTVFDPNRITHTRDIGAYLGLVPKRDQSGNVDKRLGITKAGDTLCRTSLVRAANYIIGSFGQDCDLRSFGLKIKDKGGKSPTKRASTAVARKLAVLLLSMWKSGDDYKPFRKIKNKEAIAN